jgi:hypothetical protein
MMRATLFLVLASCAASKPVEPNIRLTNAVPNARFTNAPAVTAVNDRRNVPKPPEEIEFPRYLFNFDGQFHRRITRSMELNAPKRAIGVNALDEVPDSTWFTNRVGVRDLTPEEIMIAPGGVGNPEAHKPWTIISTKVGGQTLGFIIKDSRGEKFLIKFDPRGLPEGETATQVIVGKLLWAFGFNVTEDYVVYIRPEELVLAPDAVISDTVGNKRKLEKAELDRQLAPIDRAVDGTIRVLASAWLEGVQLGGHALEGVRVDDPNDRIPHELRRDLRGAYALFAWLDHQDIHGGNLMDMWVQDPGNPNIRYVKHYWIDYGIALGFAAEKNQEPRFGYEHYLDFGQTATSLMTLGILERPWEPRYEEQQLTGVGLYEIQNYDPGTWKSSTASYIPLYDADRIDKFWASKIIMKFTREQLTAAVAAGRLSDPRASAWLVDQLIKRQRKTAQYWFQRVNPLDEFAIDDKTLCFKDLSIAYAFEPSVMTQYTVVRYDQRGKQLDANIIGAGISGVSCTPMQVTPGGEGYTIVRITTRRGEWTGTTFVHVARDPKTAAPRVIGIWRV